MAEVTRGHAIYVVNIVTVAIYHLDDALFVAAVKMPVEGVSSKHHTKNGLPIFLPMLSENFINAVQGNFNTEFHHHYHKLVFFCEKNLK